MSYFQAETIYDHRELEFRKRPEGYDIEVGTHDAASKSKGQDTLSVLPAVTCPVHTARRAGKCTIYLKNANSAFQQDFICNGHGARTVCVYGQYVIELTVKEVKITKINKYTCTVP